MIDSKVLLLDAQSSSEPPQPEQMADASADRLMTELFDDVERALEGDIEALERPAQPEVAEAEAELTLNFTEGGLPAVLLDQPLAPDSSDLATVTTPLVPVADAAAMPLPETSVPPVSQRQRFWTLNRALLGAAGLVVLATLGLWQYQRQSVEVATPTPAAAPAPTDAPVAEANAEFLEYLRRSLDVIAQNAASAPPTTPADVNDVAIALNNGGSAGLPPMGTAVLPPGGASGIPAAPGSVNVIERVYVPYPAAQAAPVAPSAPSAAAPTSGSTTAATINPAPIPNSHTLLGVLELGERSAALFEIEGVPQRVYIGERIGNSGWSLVSVANEEAVVRRNGEVRTLYIGQKF